MTSSEVLTKARATILDEGWGQGDDECIGANPAKCCVITAIGRHTQPPIGSKDFDDAVYAFVTANPHIKKTLQEWNDERGRTEKEVLSAFDAAIAFAKRLESEKKAAGTAG